MWQSREVTKTIMAKQRRLVMKSGNTVKQSWRSYSISVEFHHFNYLWTEIFKCQMYQFWKRRKEQFVRTGVLKSNVEKLAKFSHCGFGGQVVNNESSLVRWGQGSSLRLLCFSWFVSKFPCSVALWTKVRFVAHCTVVDLGSFGIKRTIRSIRHMNPYAHYSTQTHQYNLQSLLS